MTPANSSPAPDQERPLVSPPILGIVAALLVPSVMCYCFLMSTAIGWSSRPVPEFWRFPQYLASVIGFGFPWVYWVLYALARRRPWARRPLLVIGVVSLLWLPLLAIADALGLTYWLRGLGHSDLLRGQLLGTLTSREVRTAQGQLALGGLTTRWSGRSLSAISCTM